MNKSALFGIIVAAALVIIGGVLVVRENNLRSAQDIQQEPVPLAAALEDTFTVPTTSALVTTTETYSVQTFDNQTFMYTFNYRSGVFADTVFQSDASAQSATKDLISDEKISIVLFDTEPIPESMKGVAPSLTQIGSMQGLATIQNTTEAEVNRSIPATAKKLNEATIGDYHCAQYQSVDEKTNDEYVFHACFSGANGFIYGYPVAALPYMDLASMKFY